jgi:PP-loop superfamily ATP-utilizing enzyme
MIKQNINNNRQFQKICQAYLIEAKKSINKEDINKVEEIKKYVKKSIFEWEDQVKSAHFKINTLKKSIETSVSRIK